MSSRDGLICRVDRDASGPRGGGGTADSRCARRARRRRRIAVVAAGAALSAGTVAASSGAWARTATSPVSNVHIVARFDLSDLQQPENLAAAPGGVVVSFSGAHQVASVSRTGSVRILATLPCSTRPDPPT